MKKYISLLTILVSIAGWSGNGFCQILPGCPPNDLGIWKPAASIFNVRNSPTGENGTFFVIGILAENPGGLLNGLETISAKNTDPFIDDHVYEFNLTPTLRNHIGEWDSRPYNFEGQFGMYEVTIERWPYASPSPPTPFKCYTDPMDQNLLPLPVPEKLKVSFQNGPTTPTLSFDPVGWVPSAPGERYLIRIFDKDYSRCIYRVTICHPSLAETVCSKPDRIPSATFPNNRAAGSQTHEDLVPGEWYIFRADLWKDDFSGGPPMRNLSQASNFKWFRVPKKKND
jgi:hypothetical protein